MNPTSFFIRKVRRSKLLLIIVSRIYTTFFSPSTLFLGSKVIISGAFLRRVKIKVRGKNSQVMISPKVMMDNSLIYVDGDNCRVFIDGGGTNAHRCHIYVRQPYSEVIIGKGFTSEQVSLYASEGRRIVIGEDCMLSSSVYISTTDFHSVIDLKTKERLNPAMDVIIGKHVWLGNGVSILKGSFVPENSVVGKDSTVTGKLDCSNSIYVGIPVRLVKTSVTWTRE